MPNHKFEDTYNHLLQSKHIIDDLDDIKSLSDSEQIYLLRIIVLCDKIATDCEDKWIEGS